MKIVNENEIRELVEDCELGHSAYLYQDFGAIDFGITLSREEGGFNIGIMGLGIMVNDMEKELIRDEQRYNGNFSDDEIVSILTSYFKELENDHDSVASIEEFVNELGEYYRITKSLLD